MAIAFSVFLTLSALAVTNGDEHSACASLEHCVMDLNVADFTTSVGNGYSADHARQYLDNHCQNVLPAANTCVTREIPNCHNPSFVEGSRDTLMIGGYICQPENREQVLNLFQSVCVTNATVGAELGNQVVQCTNDYSDDINAAVETYTNSIVDDPSATLNLCPCLDTFETCLVDRATELCGEHVGAFYSAIWNMAIESTAPAIIRNCFEEHRVSTRAVRSVMSLFGVKN